MSRKRAREEDALGLVHESAPDKRPPGATAANMRADAEDSQEEWEQRRADGRMDAWLAKVRASAAAMAQALRPLQKGGMPDE